ncbi:MAG: SHOCT domain-containing protein [Rhodospirillaceae bacterium]|nr:SHOCT domain-containing protein [Rhodospirillaceae bacterium]MDD9918494.1 SHOCT domain-containing protein [Rhodospirillaceae bacterium]MDD9929364.1 SHOCT domain-containing protein [Rhodospirillaceae bacterium]
MTAFLIIAVIAIVLVVRWLAPSVDPRSGPASEKSPLDILRERFARGEIDQAEFDDRRQALGG